MTPTTHDIPLPDVVLLSGIYPRMPESIYHAQHCASKHALDMIANRSPLHLWHQRQHPTKRTEDMMVGSALHAALLTPDIFERDWYCVGENIDRRTKAGKDEWASLVDQFGDNILNAKQAELVMAMREAVRKHPIIRSIESSSGESELSLFWERDVDGYDLLCKARPDLLLRGKRAILDIKTTQNAALDAFTKDVFKYAYHRQAAWYLDAAAAHGIDVTDFVIVVVEKSGPHGVAVYRMDDASVAMGRIENDRLVRVYAECEKCGTWPGYPAKVTNIGLPDWRTRQIERDETDGDGWNS